MADEPTGNLDSHSEGEILQIFKDLNANGSTIVMVTHEPNIAEHCKRIITCKDGEIIKDEVVQKMNMYDLVKSSIRSLKANKMRAFLTMLGNYNRYIISNCHVSNRKRWTKNNYR